MSHTYWHINSPQFVLGCVLFLNSTVLSAKKLILVGPDKDSDYSWLTNMVSKYNLQHQNYWPWVSYLLAFILIHCWTDRCVSAQSRSLLLTWPDKQVQQNSFNPTSNNSETLIIHYLRRAVPGSEIFLFTRKTFINETSISQENGQKKHPKVCVHQPFW